MLLSLKEEQSALNSQKGQTLMELIVVMAVAIMVIGALTFATIASLRNAQFAKSQSQATKLAQEGLERVRSGRDRNEAIFLGPTVTVKSWDGDGSLGFAIWDYKIYENCDSSGSCYLKFSAASGGALEFISISNSFPHSLSESIADGFKRAIILSDRQTCTGGFTISDCYKKEKEVTVVVSWSDFSGQHESKLTTILRKL